MIDKLDQLVENISGLNSKLVLLIGPRKSGKSNLLRQLAALKQMQILNVGAAVGRGLVTVPSAQRHLHVADIFNGLSNEFASHGLVLVDNIELLFDQTLQISPVDLLKRQAHIRRVVAIWPGEFEQERLSYTITGHPEHRDYGIDGLVPFIIR
jgi:hypothetical protein